MRLPMQLLIHAGFYKGDNQETLPATLGSLDTLRTALHRALVGRELFTFVATQTWLAIYLMEQRRLGLASEWSPYLDFLPEAFPDLPIFYHDRDWEWLRGSSFVQRTEKHREQLRKQFETVEDLVPGFSRNYTFEEFLWARSVVSSRVFGWRLPGVSTDDTDFMVPFGDMFNHRSPKQIEWIFNETSKTLDFWVREDVPAGSELLISYGGKCNSQYLLHYGFALPTISSRVPPLSTVRLALDLDPDVPDRAWRERWLMKQRLQEDADTLVPEEFELKATFAGNGAENFLSYARLLSLPSTGEDFLRTVKRSCRMYSTPPKCDKPLGLSIEAAAIRRGLLAVTEALSRYDTSLEEDESILLTLSGLPLKLVTLRRDEKVVLHWWRRFLGIASDALKDTTEGIEAKAREFPEFSPEAQYLLVTVMALVKVESSYSLKATEASLV